MTIAARSYATASSRRKPTTFYINPLRRRGNDLPIQQVVIDHFMNTRGAHLEHGDQLVVTLPEYGAYLPSTSAEVVVRGGSVCRTPDNASGTFRVRDGARLIARGASRVRVHDISSADVYNAAAADLFDTSTAYLYSARGSAHARTGTTVYAWAGQVRAEKGAVVWLMGDDVSLDAAPGAHVADGADSPLLRQEP